jgi:predicted secreted protein
LHDAKTRLDAWRAAETRRDGLVRGSPDWQAADAEAQSAKKAFDAAFAQAYARYTEERYQARNPHWSAEGERRTSSTE